MATTNAAVSFRTVESVKTEAFKIIAQYGMTPSQLFNMVMAEIVHTKSLPLNLNYLSPNAQTLAAIEELESGQAESFDVEPHFSAEQLAQQIMGANREPAEPHR